ncbi:hypothetical protein VF21_05592 [Pseudogymnoascus sp. 05NY08]|nr:hypothetical protein VF21_05592 [Pseudogymnoascus sp. 05NY08]
MSSKNCDEIELPLASTPAPPGLSLGVINQINYIMEEMKSILEQSPDGDIRKYVVDTLNDATMVCMGNVYKHHKYPLLSWMAIGQEQVPVHKDDDEGGTSQDEPSARKKKCDSLPPAKQFVANDDAYRSQTHHNSIGKPRTQPVTRQTRLATARMKGNPDGNSTEQLPEDSIVSLRIPITTMRTIGEDQERVMSLYFTLINFTTVIKKNNRNQSYTISSDHAIEIVNFFLGAVFHSSGAKMVELMIKEYSKSNDWKDYESSQKYSGPATMQQAIRDIHLAYKAEE